MGWVPVQRRARAAWFWLGRVWACETPAAGYATVVVQAGGRHMFMKTSGAAGTVDQTLETRYADVKRRVAEAAKSVGRKAQDIAVVAVTKFAEADQIRALIQLGHRDFGENKVQNLITRTAMIGEFMSRRRVLPHAGHHAGGPVDSTIRWHMIGHLQRNKAKKAVELCR